jgi:hypothetical protein
VTSSHRSTRSSGRRATARSRPLVKAGHSLARAPDDDEPLDGRDPRGAPKIGQAGEHEEIPLNLRWVETSGSAESGLTLMNTYTTTPVELEVPPIEEVAGYAKLEGVDLGALRAYARANLDEASRSADRAGQHAAAHWRDVVSVLDADDLELVVRAHTERLSAGDVATHFERRIKRDPGTRADALRELLGLLDAPFEDVVDYAHAKGRPLGPLRAYAAGRASAAGASGDAGAGAAAGAYWSDVVRYIDGL